MHKTFKKVFVLGNLRFFQCLLFFVLIIGSLFNFSLADNINLCYNFKEFNKVKALTNLNFTLWSHEIFDWKKLLIMGKADFYLREFVSAQRYFQKALKVADDSIKKSVARYWLGRCLLEQNRDEQAVDCFNQIIKYNQNPESDFLFYYGIALYRLGKYADGLNCLLNYESRTKTEQQPVELPYFIGATALCSHNFELAEKYLKLAIQKMMEIKNPRIIAELFFLLGLSYYLSNDKDQSINTLKNLNTADTGLQNKIKLVLGTLYLEKKDYKKAINELNAITLDTNDEFKAQTHFRMGMANLKLNQYEKALQYFDSVIINFPNTSLSVWALYNTGEIYHRQNKLTRAKRAYRKILASYVDGSFVEEAMVNLANIIYQEKNYLEAVAIYEQFLNKFPRSQFRPQALFNLIKSYYILANFAKVKFFGEQFVREFPQDDDIFEVYYLLGQVGIQHRNYYYAIQNFAKITQGDLYGYALKGIADAYFTLDSLESAINFYNVAEKNSRDTLLDLVRYNRELVYLRQGVYSDEIAMRKSYLEKYPQAFNRAKIQYEIGHLYYLANKFDSAIAELEKVSIIDTITSFVLAAEIEKSQCYSHLGDTNKAIDNYLRIIQEFPRTGILHKPLSAVAQLYYAKARYDSALVFYNKLIQEFPQAVESESAHWALAKSYYSLGRIDEAVRVLDRFKQRYPNSIMLKNIYFELADYYIELGKYSLAEKTINESFEKFGKSGSGFFRLATIYRKKGKLDEALNYFINAYNAYRQEKNLAMLGITLYEAGNVAVELKNWQRAKEFFDRCLKESEDERLRISAQNKLDQIQEKLKE